MKIENFSHIFMIDEMVGLYMKCNEEVNTCMRQKPSGNELALKAYGGGLKLW